MVHNIKTANFQKLVLSSVYIKSKFCEPTTQS